MVKPSPWFVADLAFATRSTERSAPPHPHPPKSFPRAFNHPCTFVSSVWFALFSVACNTWATSSFRRSARWSPTGPRSRRSGALRRSRYVGCSQLTRPRFLVDSVTRIWIGRFPGLSEVWEETAREGREGRANGPGGPISVAGRGEGCAPGAGRMTAVEGPTAFWEDRHKVSRNDKSAVVATLPARKSSLIPCNPAQPTPTCQDASQEPEQAQESRRGQGKQHTQLISPSTPLAAQLSTICELCRPLD